MANIEKELFDIQVAVYGEEVRGSIHDAIDKINKATISYESNLDDWKEATEASINDAIAAMTAWREHTDELLNGDVATNLSNAVEDLRTTDAAILAKTNRLGTAAYHDENYFLVASAVRTVPASASATSNATYLRNDNSWHTISPADIGAAMANHGNHVPNTESVNNARFLRNDNTWQTITPANIGAALSSHGNHLPALATGASVSNKKFLRNDGTWQDVTPANIGASAATHSHSEYAAASHTHTLASLGAAASSHGNHVPTKQTADNATFLRNDNTWQKVTPANIGAAAASHNHNSLYLPITGATAKGVFKCNNHDGNAGVPVVSSNSDKQKVATIGCKDATTIGFSAQWDRSGTNFSYRYVATSTSDIRLKDNIEDTTVDALSVLNQIPLHSFDWKDDEKHWDVGFIAQELEKIDPNMIIKPESEKNGYWAVNSFYICGLLVKAVQELSKKVEELSRR